MKETTALALARTLMNTHGLHRWTVAFDKAIRRFGSCSHRKRRITLSEPLIRLNSKHEVRDTILHEIAHALCGHRHGHDAKWKVTAARIGARPERCYGDTVITPPPSHHPPRYVFRCPNCGETSESNRKPWRASACGGCCDRYADGQFDERFALVCEDRSGNPVEYEDDKLEQWIANHKCSSCGYLLSRRKCNNQRCRSNVRSQRKAVQIKGEQHQ
jgi:predicted SprT family Zn-dependent metalloprotease